MNGDSSQDQEILHLLNSLKGEETPYPQEMMDKQRDAYKKGAALLGASVVISFLWFKGAFKLAMIENVLKWILIGVVGTSLVTVGGYVYSNEIRHWLMPPTPVIEPISSGLQPYATAAASHATALDPLSASPEPSGTPNPTPAAYLGTLVTPTFDVESVIEQVNPTVTPPGLRIGHTPTPFGQREDKTPPAASKTPRP